MRCFRAVLCLCFHFLLHWARRSARVELVEAFQALFDPKDSKEEWEDRKREVWRGREGGRERDRDTQSLAYRRALSSSYSPAHLLSKVFSSAAMLFVAWTDWCPYLLRAKLFDFQCFQETTLGKFPQHWEHSELGKTTGNMYTGPSRSSQKGWNILPQFFQNELPLVTGLWAALFIPT
jgi:hypothetical protein